MAERFDRELEELGIRLSEEQKDQFHKYYEMLVECLGKTWRVHSTDFSPVGSEIGLRITPEDIHIMHRSPESSQTASDSEEGGEEN